MIKDNEKTSDRIYDQCAETYGYDIRVTFPMRLKYELVRKYAQPSHLVLDVGCANGLHMVALADRCAEIMGVDINERMLALARERFQANGATNAAAYRQSASALDFPNEKFDLVYSFSTLLLVPDTDKALAEIARVLKSGGIAVLDITGCYNLSRVYWTWYYRRHGHFGINTYSHEEIRRILGSLGMEIIETHASGFADQWKYIPGIHKMKFLDKVFHGPGEPDLDYRLSNHPLLFPLANRWYLVCRKLS